MRFLIAFFLLFFCFFSGLQAEEEMVYLSQKQVHQGSYHAVGDTIEIAGTVEGSAYLSGTHIIISGCIEGDLFALAGTIEITGRVLGTARILAGQAIVGGIIEGNTTIVTANASMESSGVIKGNALIFAGNVEMENLVVGDVTALASSLKVSGTIQHNLQSFVGQLKITERAKILGDLKYRSDESATIDPKALIGGEVLYRRSLLRDLKDIPFLKRVLIGSKVVTFLMNFFYTFVWGVLLIRMFPKKLEKTLLSLQSTPLKSFVYGLVLLVLFPLASILLLITVIGAPFALTLIALNIVSFYTVKVFAILWISNWLFSKWKWKQNKIPTLAAGQILYYVLAAIPVVGIFIAFFCMVLGLGAVAVAQTR